jgi:hypothetical protein
MHALMHDLDHPDEVDLTILEKVSRQSERVPFWRSPLLVPFGIASLLLLTIIALALVLQALRR